MPFSFDRREAGDLVHVEVFQAAGRSCGTLVLTPEAADELVARLQRPLPDHVWRQLPPKPTECACGILYGMRGPSSRRALERDCPVHGELTGCTCEWHVSGRGRVLRDPLCSVHVPPKTPPPPATERQLEPPNADEWEGEPQP